MTRSTTPPPNARLLADHSHHSTPLSTTTGASSTTSSASSRSSTSHIVYDLSPDRDYSEKELDEAMAFLGTTSSSSPRRPTRSGLPSWATSLSTTSSWKLFDRKVNRSCLSRRALLCALVSLVIVSTLFGAISSDSTLDAGGKREGRAGVLDSVAHAPARFKQTLQEFGKTAWEKTHGPTKDPVYVGLDPLLVLNFATPQATLKSQLKEGIRYITTMAFGGHANQFISIQRALYFGTLTNRVGIIPTLTPIHIQGAPENMSTFYDLDRFYAESGLPAVEFSQVKPCDLNSERPATEHLSIYSIQEATVGFPNREAWSYDLHDIVVDFWPLPPLSRGIGGFDIAFDALKLFDFDVWGKMLWIERVKLEQLPQQPENTPDKTDDLAMEKNIKDGFNPRKAQSQPDDQILAFDNTMFLGPAMFPRTYDTEIPMEPNVPGEAASWEIVGQYFRFNNRLERLADDYLVDLFNVNSASKIPPFISMHLRRGDFKDFGIGGFTPLERYVKALERVRYALQKRLDDDMSAWQGPGHKHFRSYGIKADQYPVVVTTDEAMGSDFVKEVRALGWKVLDHDKMETMTKLGGWYPTMLDATILARGSSFVGTDRSTFSHLAGLRCKYWRGGLVETA